jgi:ribosomal protein RSM22 (predicted rRNA methylase)
MNEIDKEIDDEIKVIATTRTTGASIPIIIQPPLKRNYK